MLKKKNLFVVLLACGLLLSSCDKNPVGGTTSSNSNVVPTTTTSEGTTPGTSREPTVTKACVELLVGEEFASDAVATVTGVNSQITLSTEPGGIIYSTDFHKDETVQLTASSLTGKYDYYFWVSKTVGDGIVDEDIYLDENGAGTFTLDCDSVVINLVGVLNEDWVDPNASENIDTQILEYYEYLNQLFSLDGEYLETFYGWLIDATDDFTSPTEAASYIAAFLPSEFSLLSDESENENNVWYIYVDSTVTYQIDIAVYLDDEYIVGEITLGYVTGSPVPDPSTGVIISDPILEYYEAINTICTFKGTVTELYYQWVVDVTDFASASDAMTFIAENLPSNFSLYLDLSEDENNLYHIYIDDTETYQLDISIYPDGSDVIGVIQLSYTTGDVVPNPNAGTTTTDPALEYYKALNELFSLTGEYLEVFYGWILDVSYFDSATEAATTIGELLPSDFALFVDVSEDESNIWLIYLDSTEIYQIDISVYVDGEDLIAEVTLSTTTGDILPNPSASNNGDMTDSELIIREIAKNLDPSIDPALDVDYFAHINGEPGWFYLSYKVGVESVVEAINDGMSYMPENVSLMDGEEYYDEGYVWCVNDELSVIVEISAYETDTVGVYQVVITVMPV